MPHCLNIKQVLIPFFLLLHFYFICMMKKICWGGGGEWNLEVAQEKIVVATIVITFVANICQKVVTLGYLGLDLQ